MEIHNDILGARVLGIDQSYNSTGIVIVNNGDIEYFNVIKTDKSIDNIYDRALTIALEVSKIVEERAISNINIEGLGFGSVGNATRDLAGLQFTIINICKLKNPNLIFLIVSPNTVKKFATGSGKATKSDMIDALPDNVKQSFTDRNYKKSTGLADLTDAYFIGLYSTT
jgi:Holliday junction resolvasome RuvABC endonuclease subunit